MEEDERAIKEKRDRLQSELLKGTPGWLLMEILAIA